MKLQDISSVVAEMSDTIKDLDRELHEQGGFAFALTAKVEMPDGRWNVTVTREDHVTVQRQS